MTGVGVTVGVKVEVNVGGGGVCVTQKAPHSFGHPSGLSQTVSWSYCSQAGAVHAIVGVQVIPLTSGVNVWVMKLAFVTVCVIVNITGVGDGLRESVHAGNRKTKSNKHVPVKKRRTPTGNCMLHLPSVQVRLQKRLISHSHSTLSGDVFQQG